MKYAFFALLLMGLSFFAGRYVGRFDGPEIVNWYAQAPIEWSRSGMIIEPCGIEITCNKEPKIADGWSVRDITFNMGAKEIYGHCPEK